jgi:uncharacterized membrane protein
MKEEKAVSKQSKTSRNRTTRVRRLKLTTVLVTVALLAIAAVTVVSRQHARANEATASERNLQVAKDAKFTTVKVAGQDVQVDGQTGQMKPLTQEEAQKLAAGLADMVNQSTEGLEQVQHADGSVSMDLKGRFQNVSVARINQDGSVTQSCVDNPQAAGAFFGIDPKLIENPSMKPTENQPNPQPVKDQQ